MKNINKITLSLVILFTSFVMTLQGQEDKMVTITADGSRLIEDKNEFDSGLDIVATLVLDKDTKFEKIIRFEAFPNINYYKFGIGGNYVMQINNKKRHRFIELVAGIEGGVIYRKNLPRTGSEGQIYDRKSFSAFLTYAVNFEFRYYITDRIPLIISNNSQKRNDFKIYGENAETTFVNSNYIGIGFIF